MLHRCLDGDPPLDTDAEARVLATIRQARAERGEDDERPVPPDDWILVRVCDEFQCVPSVAERELRIDPERVFEVMTLRGYAKAKQAYDRLDELQPKQRVELMNDPTVQLVRDTDFALAAEAMRHG